MNKLALLGGSPVISKPLKPYPSLGEREMAAVNEVMKSGCLSGFYGSPGPDYYGGEVVRDFEAAWRQRYGVRHAISVNSATSGLQAALGAIGISPGDEVIVPPYTMSATVMAPIVWGGIPVFVDVDPDTFCLDPALVREAITPKTKVILVVNLFGNPAPLQELKAIADEHGLWLIEDSAQAPLGVENGQLCGTIGDIGVFSLNYHKHIHSGEGGVCITDSDELAQKMAMIRNHGENVVEEFGIDLPVNIVGFNLRMTELHAAVAHVQLDQIEEHVSRRERVAQILTEGTGDLPGWQPPQQRENTRHNYYMWTVRYDESVAGIPRNVVSRALNAEGFVNEVGYIAPLYRLPMFQKRMAIGRDGFPFSLSQREYHGALCPVTECLYEKEVIQYQPPSWDVDEVGAELLVLAVRKVMSQLDQLRNH